MVRDSLDRGACGAGCGSGGRWPGGVGASRTSRAAARATGAGPRGMGKVQEPSHFCHDEGNEAARTVSAAPFSTAVTAIAARKACASVARVMCLCQKPTGRSRSFVPPWRDAGPATRWPLPARRGCGSTTAVLPCGRTQSSAACRSPTCLPSRSRGTSRSSQFDLGSVVLFVGGLLYGIAEGYPRHSRHASDSDNNYPRYNSDGSPNYGPSGSSHHHSISTGGGDPANSYYGGYAGLGAELGELFSYGSCDISAQTPPPPPPPTAETGLRENPGKRPVGQAAGRGTTPQPGTKTAATGPSDTAPVELHGSTTTPAAYNPAGTATMAAAEPSGGLGSIMPVDPSAGMGTTLVTPVDGSAGAGTTLVTPVDDSAGAGSTTVTPVDPSAGAGLTTSFPAQLQSGHVLHSADGGPALEGDPYSPDAVAARSAQNTAHYNSMVNSNGDPYPQITDPRTGWAGQLSRRWFSDRPQGR